MTRRPWFRYSLRTLFVLVTAVCVCAWIVSQRPYRVQGSLSRSDERAILTTLELAATGNNASRETFDPRPSLIDVYEVPGNKPDELRANVITDDGLLVVVTKQQGVWAIEDVCFPYMRGY